MHQNVINFWLPIAIREIAFELGLLNENIINIYDEFGGANFEKWELMCDGMMCDGCHPNPFGYS
jgi:hypothetical protein